MNVDKVNELRAIKETISGLNTTLKDLSKRKSQLESDIIMEMNDEGLSLARTDFGTVSVTKTDVASVKDWNAFEEYIYANHALHLLQRRPSDAAYREELAAMGEIPGVETFTKVNLSLTNKAT
jgi:hypothetical protein